MFQLQRYKKIKIEKDIPGKFNPKIPRNGKWISDKADYRKNQCYE